MPSSFKLFVAAAGARTYPRIAWLFRSNAWMIQETVLPVLARPAASTGLAFVPLAEPTVERIVGVLTRKEETLLPSVAALHELALRSLAQFTRRKGAGLV